MDPQRILKADCCDHSCRSYIAYYSSFCHFEAPPFLKAFFPLKFVYKLKFLERTCCNFEWDPLKNRSLLFKGSDLPYRSITAKFRFMKYFWLNQCSRRRGNIVLRLIGHSKLQFVSTTKPTFCFETKTVESRLRITPEILYEMLTKFGKRRF